MNGPNFYNLPVNKEKLKLIVKPRKVAEFVDILDENKIIGQIKPFHAGETLSWQVKEVVS